MQRESLERYLAKVEEKLKELESLISSSQVSIERRSPNRFVLKGLIIFIDGSSLHFLEYVLEEDNMLLRVSYRFHYTKQDNSLVFRYDNAHIIQSFQHFHTINTYPETRLFPPARRVWLMY